MKTISACTLGIACALSAGCASNKNASIYGDKHYSEGSIITQDGYKMKAVQGKWIPVSEQKETETTVQHRQPAEECTSRCNTQISTTTQDPQLATEVITNVTWTIGSGSFDIDPRQIKSTGRDNFIWMDTPLDNFEIMFVATKAPHSDFRINIGSSSLEAYRQMGSFYQIMIPWEGGDSRIDYFTNGSLRHISAGYRDIQSDKYSVRLTMQERHLKVWIDGQLNIDIVLNNYTGGYIGFGEMAGIVVENIQIEKQI